jgi:predicted transposase YbfD/YdcC
LNEILFLTICAVISDCNAWDEIEDFGIDKLKWLHKYLPIQTGIPSHDTVVGYEELPKETRELWPAVKSIVKLISIRKYKGSEDAFEKRFYISSYSVDAKQMGQHWSVENSLHWVLDVSFHEDRGKKQANNAASNFSIILKMGMNLLNHVEGKKTSLTGKRKKCARSDKFGEKALIV